MASTAPAPAKGGGKLGAWWARLPGWEKFAIIGGAGVGGYFLYRWWQNRSSSSSSTAATTPSSTSPDTTTGSGGTGSGGGSPWQVGGYQPGGNGWWTGTQPNTPSSSGIPSGTPSVGPLIQPGAPYQPAPGAPVATAKPATATPPVGLTGVTYGSGGQITLAPGETLSTPVTVPNASAGNPTVPLSDLISTGSTNTLSSAYGNATTAAQASQGPLGGSNAAALALAKQQIAAATITAPTATKTTAKTTPAQAPGAATAKAATTTAKASGGNPAAGHTGITK